MVKMILGSALGGFVAAGVALVAAGQVRSDASAVQCAPYQEEAIHRVSLNGREAAALACVDRADDGMVYYQPGDSARQPYARPASYVPRAPMAQPAVQARRVSGVPASERAVSREPAYEPDVRPARRSIAKTAMIIGGSAGAGAGVGAIAGGRKGGLIGAAIGGGVAAIYEATKR